jgi:hypothetical protein
MKKIFLEFENTIKVFNKPINIKKIQSCIVIKVGNNKRIALIWR